MNHLFVVRRGLDDKRLTVRMGGKFGLLRLPGHHVRGRSFVAQGMC